MMEEVKVFNGGGMNSDDAIEYMERNDILDALNIRIQHNEGNSQGYVSTIEGTTEIANVQLPIGINKSLGSRYFSETGKAYIFLLTSEGNFRIEEFDVPTQTFTKVYEDTTDSGDVEIFPQVNTTSFIKDIKLVDGKLLYWVLFPNDEVYRIDITRAKEEDYGTLVASDFYIGVPVPYNPITFKIETDSYYSGNDIKTNLFQFRYRLKYSNNEYSPYSAISNRAAPELEKYIYSDNTNNVIVLDVSINTSRVEAVEISARMGNGLWSTIKEATLDYILSLPDENTTPTLGFVDYKGNSVTGEIRLITPFYNNIALLADDQLEHDLLADAIPLNTRAIELVNNNVLLLSNNKTGYGKIDGFDLKAESSSYLPTVIDVGADFRITKSEQPGLWSYRIRFAGDPQEGDILRFYFTRLSSPTGVPVDFVEGSYTVTSVTANNRALTVQAALVECRALASWVDEGLVVIETINEANYYEIFYRVAQNVRTGGFFIELLNPTETNLNFSIPSLKMNSSYQVAVAYYDKYGRPFPLITNSKGIANTTPPQNLSGGQLPTIQWSIQEEAPLHAAYYDILITENLTTLQTYQGVAKFIGNVIDGNPTLVDGKYMYALSIIPFTNIQTTDTKSQFSYDYTNGDKISIIGNVSLSGDVYNKPQPNNNIIAYYDGDATHTDAPLLSVYYDEPLANINNTEDVLIEITTPIKRIVDSDFTGTAFYSTGNRYKVVDGLNTVTSGTIFSSDTWYKTRLWRFPVLGTDGTILVEDFSYSDYYDSRFTNLGVPRSVGDVAEGQTRKCQIRYSREYYGEGEVNNIVRFYPEDTYESNEYSDGVKNFGGASEQYGGIQYLSVRENRLACIQETKVGYIPVNKAVIADETEQQQIAISSRLLNPIYYPVGQDIGIGRTFAIPSYVFQNGYGYFVDPHRMLPARTQTNGTEYIANKFSSKLKEVLKQTITDNTYVIGHYDDRYKEYIIFLGDICYVYSEKSNKWVSRYSYSPESSFTADDLFYTLRQGKLHAHNNEDNEFYGEVFESTINFPLTSAGVKTYQSLGIHSDDLLTTTLDGIQTQLGHVSDLVEEDFDFIEREGVFKANFLRDSTTDIINGDRLKGRWISLDLTTNGNKMKLFKVIVKSQISSTNE